VRRFNGCAVVMMRQSQDLFCACSELQGAPMPPLLPAAAIDFRYSAPERGFDRSRVKGVVANLTRVADPATATALEVAAGGKLYQVGGLRMGCWLHALSPRMLGW